MKFPENITKYVAVIGTVLEMRQEPHNNNCEMDGRIMVLKPKSSERKGRLFGYISKRHLQKLENRYAG